MADQWQPRLLAPPKPTATMFDAVTGHHEDGKPFLLLGLGTFAGTNYYFLSPDEALRIGEWLVRMAGQAASAPPPPPKIVIAGANDLPPNP